MKNILLGFASVGALVATPVLAADMPVKARPTAPVSVDSWTGCYVGANIGGIWDARQHAYHSC
jgi:outer membrane immunogenic protein